MSSLKSSLLISLLVLVSACGRQVVEFALDGGTTDGATDARTDASTDAPTDAPIAIRPTVISTTPAAGAINVSLATTVTATFSKPMNAGTLTMATFVLRQGATTLTGPVTVNTAGTTATLTPSAALTPGLTYTATITMGAMDSSGLTLVADHIWMFTAAANALPPTVISTMPSPNATNVAIAVSPTATFSKAMNGATINMTTFTLVQGATPITGVVTLNGATNTATFNPNADLTSGLVYTARITTGAQDTGGLGLTADYVWTFTAGTSVVLPPMVVSTTPAAGALNVAVGVSPTALFDQPMNTATINMTTFTLARGATPIAGTVLLDLAGTTATFDPLVDLTAGVYTATITTGAQGTSGMALTTAYTWMFTVGTVVVLPPMVVSTTPLPNALNVAVGVSPTALFDQPMNTATINMTTFTLARGATPIAGTVLLDLAGTTATFDPLVDLTAGVYTATITTGAQGTSGMPLATAYTWMFTVGISMLAPTVVSTTPLPNALNVAIGVSPTATFSQPMNMLTINMTTFTLSLGATPITGTVMYDALTTTATFDPLADLAPGLYTATITTGAQDTNGVPLALAHTWTFRVGMSTACVVPTVVLGTSGAFAVLSGSGVMNTGPSMITGDLGVYPLTAVTGFPPGILVGTEYAGIAPSDTAQGDLTTAYNDAQGRTLCLTSLIGDMGGKTLPPGLYKSTSVLSLDTGDLVLDAEGDANAVWIFAMTAELLVSTNRQVTIIGGGSAANVFWAVGSSATFGTGSRFKGTVMADQSISFATGAVLDGRALARIAAVTLQSTTITRP